MVVALVSLAAVIVAHAVWRRLSRDGNAVVSFVVCAVVGATFVAVRDYAVRGAAIASASVLVFGLGCELYLFAFTLVAQSVSAVLLAELRDRPRPPRELESLYTTEDMVRKREAQMLRTGLLRQCSSGYEITNRGARLLAAFDGLRSFFFPVPGSR